MTSFQTTRTVAIMSGMAERKIGIGLIGVGRHGSRYLHHLIGDVPGAFLAAVCRRRVDEQQPAELAHVPLYGSYHDLIADPRVQAVIVVTPPSLCHDICLAAAQAGKTLLIEKPLAINGKEARAMVAAAEQAGIMLMTAHTMRFDPVIPFVKGLLPSLGSLRVGKMTSHIEWKASLITRTVGASLGALLELGVHLLDLVRFLTDQEVAEAACKLDRPPGGASETAVKATLRTVGGICCELDVARTEGGRAGNMEWVGTNGTLSADWVQRRVVRTSTQGETDQWSVEASPTIVAVLRSFVDAIRTSNPPPVTGLDGCRAVEIADACYESDRRNGDVVSLA